MTNWTDIERDFRNALIAAFDINGLKRVLKYCCNRDLEDITTKSGKNNIVDDVIDDAVRYGWLEKLAAGALAENERHTGLKATVPIILQGVEIKGRAYYQVAQARSETTSPELPTEETDQSKQAKAPHPRFPEEGKHEPPPEEDSIAWRKYSNLGADVASGCLATLLAAVITAIAAYVLRTFAADPERALDVAVTFLVAIGLVAAILAFRSSRQNLGIGAIVFTACVILFHFVIDYYAPWCTDTPVQLEYQLTDTDHQIVQGNMIPVETGSDIRIFAEPFSENVNKKRFICAWEYLGDGEILDSPGLFGIDQHSCQVLVKVGTDGAADLISAIVGQRGCQEQKRRFALLKPIVGGGG